MNALQPLAPDAIPEESRDVLESVSGETGNASNLYRVLAHSPAALRAYVALNKLVADSGLSPAERRVALLTASFENRCGYCVAAYSVGAQKSGLDSDTLEALRAGRKIATNDRLEALRSFTSKLVRKRGDVSEEDVREFLAADFEEKNILDVILIVSMETLSNYTNVAAQTPLDERFKQSEWNAPQPSERGRRESDRSIHAGSTTRH